MAENMMCKTQKASSQKFRDNYDRTFSCNKVTVHEEGLPGHITEHLYPEEIRILEIDRKLRREGC